MMTMTSAAAEFRSLYDNAADLMTALDAAGIPSEQDWANERTVWTFDDGSQISVSCGEIEVTPALSCERTINGIPVKRARVYPEGDYWRWSMIDIDGNEYVDGGNYRTSEAAERGLEDAFDPA